MSRFGCYRKSTRTQHPVKRQLRPAFEQLESRRLLSAQAAATPTYVLYHPADNSGPLASSAPPTDALTPNQIRHAYGFDQTSFSRGAIQGDGSGQTIAIIDAYDDPNILLDLEQFDSYYGLADPPNFAKVSQTGSAMTLPGTDPAGAGNHTWELETSLDVEWAHALAPGAGILLIEANSDSDTDLYAAVDYARNAPGVSVVSMSFGRQEHAGDPSDNSHFSTPAGHVAITFLASTGDAGQPAEYPSYSPNVVAVGGTNLSVDGAGNYLGESGWSGSGGGISTVEPQPAYQNGIAAPFIATMRTAPDVAFDAGSYVSVCDSWDYGASTPWVQTGGTSFSVQVWGALVAIADQGRSSAGLPTLDGATQTLPLLYSLPGSDFHDITTGNNGSNAGPGYDLVTGLGSPIAPSVVAELIGPFTVRSSKPTASGTVTTPPTSFAIDFSSPVATTNLSAFALQVNGMTATSVTELDANTLMFQFDTSPVTTPGLQTMSIAAGAFSRQCDGVPLSAFSATFTYVVLPTPLASVNPAGSLIYQSTAGASIDLPDDSESFSLSVASGQSLTVLVTPAAGLRPGVSLSGLNVSSSASSSAPGTPVILQTVPITAAGTYTFTVSGLNSSVGSYTVQVNLNAALSTSAHGGAANNSLITAQNIDASFVPLEGGADRGAVAGTITTGHRSAADAFGYQAVTVAPQFDDISSTGTPILKGVDDGFVSVKLTGTFAFPFYGTPYSTFNVSSNGLVTLGNGTGTSAYANTNLQSSPSGPAIAPLWDDLVVSGATNSSVYWQVKGSGSSQRLVMEWNDVSFATGHNTGLVTFEAILSSDGTILFNYKSLDSGDSHAEGVTATVGFKNGGDQSSARDCLLLSFKSSGSPYLGDGVSTVIGVGVRAPDVYAFSLAVDQTVTLAVTSQNGGAVGVSFKDAEGNMLASGTTLNTDVGQMIENFAAVGAGEYFAVVSGDDGTPYTLVVDRNSDFDAKKGIDFATAQNISGTAGVLGAILAGSPDDWYGVNVSAGSDLLVRAYALGGGPQQLDDNLSPQLELYGPSDALLASSSGGVNPSIVQQATVGGVYRIHVSGGGTTGEYFVNTAIDSAPPTVAIVPVGADPQVSPVAQLQIDFSEPINGFTLNSLSLTRNGGPNLLASSQSLTTADNTTFALGNLAGLTNVPGTYLLTLNAAASAIVDSAGGVLANGATVSFVENVPAQVTNTTDGGPGSLRQACLDMSGALGLMHEIDFELPFGPQNIDLLSPLPAITDPLIAILDGNQDVTITSSLSAAWGNLNALAKTGSGKLTLAGSNNFAGPIEVDSGTLQLAALVTPTFTAETEVTVAGNGMFELAGSVSNLTSAMNIINNSAAADGLLVSGTSQVVGHIDGIGNLTIGAGGDLTASQIVQNALVIGGAPGSLALVTIAASNAAGNQPKNSASSGTIAAVTARPTAAGVSITASDARACLPAIQVVADSEMLPGPTSEPSLSSHGFGQRSRPGRNSSSNVDTRAEFAESVEFLRDLPPVPGLRFSLASQEMASTPVLPPAFASRRDWPNGFRSLVALDVIFALEMDAERHALPAHGSGQRSTSNAIDAKLACPIDASFEALLQDHMA